MHWGKSGCEWRSEDTAAGEGEGEGEGKGQGDQDGDGGCQAIRPWIQISTLQKVAAGPHRDVGLTEYEYGERGTGRLRCPQFTWALHYDRRDGLGFIWPWRPQLSSRASPSAHISMPCAGEPSDVCDLWDLWGPECDRVTMSTVDHLRTGWMRLPALGSAVFSNTGDVGRSAPS